MLREEDIPCSDCGAELVGRTVEAQELSASRPIEGTIRLAECPACGARCFPEQSLSKLSTRPGGNQVDEGGETP